MSNRKILFRRLLENRRRRHGVFAVGNSGHTVEKANRFVLPSDSGAQGGGLLVVKVSMRLKFPEAKTVDIS